MTSTNNIQRVMKKNFTKQTKTHNVVILYCASPKLEILCRYFTRQNVKDKNRLFTSITANHTCLRFPVIRAMSAFNVNKEQLEKNYIVNTE